jgi:hypothetical protein
MREAAAPPSESRTTKERIDHMADYNNQNDEKINAIVRQMTRANQLTQAGNQAASPLLAGVFASLANEVRDINSQYKQHGADDTLSSTDQQAMLRAQQINNQLAYQRRQAAYRERQVNPQDLAELNALFAKARQSKNTQKPQPVFYPEEESDDGMIQMELPLQFNDERSNSVTVRLEENDRSFIQSQVNRVTDQLGKIYDLLKTVFNDFAPITDDEPTPYIMDEEPEQAEELEYLEEAEQEDDDQPELPFDESLLDESEEDEDLFLEFDEDEKLLKTTNKNTTNEL